MCNQVFFSPLYPYPRTFIYGIPQYSLTDPARFPLKTDPDFKTAVSYLIWFRTDKLSSDRDRREAFHFLSNTACMYSKSNV